jgi:hypothetical protein
MTAPIKAKVARVLGARELVINKGAQDGVWEGMKFAVLDLSASDVTDPDTKENLGSIYLEKVRVEIVKTEPHVSLARTYIKVGGGGYGFGLSNIQGLLGASEPRYETFIGPSATFDESKSIVHRGDVVQQIVEINPHRVVETVPVFESPELREPVPGLKAVVLEPLEGTSKTKSYHPTTRDYRAGAMVSWDWDMRRAYQPMWYMGPEGQPVKAWNRSRPEFAGRELTPAEVAAESDDED